MESILNELEFKVIESPEEVILGEADEVNSVVKKLFKLSIVPNFESKITAIDKVKNIHVELRKLPALELVLGLTQSYPA